MTPSLRRFAPRSGEFFAPAPIASVALLIANDRWLKPTYHNALTGKLSDVAICFFLPLFVSELLGLAFGVTPRARLWVGAVVTTLLFAGLEEVAPFTRFAIRCLSNVGPLIGVSAPFRMTSDWTDLLCLVAVPVAIAYGRQRLELPSRCRSEPAKCPARLAPSHRTARKRRSFPQSWAPNHRSWMP